MSFTKILSTNLDASVITAINSVSSVNTTATTANTTATIANTVAVAAYTQANAATEIAAAAYSQANNVLTINSVQISDSSYVVSDDLAANTSGTSYLVINGSGFTDTCIVIVGTTNASSTTFANSTQLRASVAAQNAASYPVYVTDTTTGATATKINGLTYSSFPVWGTSASLDQQSVSEPFSVYLSANSDSSITYSNTSALPDGTTLLANGYFYGSISSGATYSFDIKATDTENQDQSRTFSLLVSSQTATYAVDYVVVGGGGAGKQQGVVYPAPTGQYPGLGGGGGGGGGVITGSFTATRSSPYSITVGAGGSSVSPATVAAPSGSSSSIVGTGVSQTIGGGAGAQAHRTHPGSTATITSGGNYGGAAGNYPTGGGAGGAGGPLMTLGANWVKNGGGAGGGGGAGPGSNGGVGGGTNESLTAGGRSTTKGQFGGTGGNGLTVSIYGTPTTYGGGGAGGATFTESYAPFAPYSAPLGTGMHVVPTSGGTGGGGNSSYGRGWVISNSDYSVAPNGVPYAQNWTPGTSGGTNTGGGGAGGTQVLNFCTNATTGSGTTQMASLSQGSGGSGIVIISMPTAQYPGSAPGATVTTPPAAPGKTILTYNSSGTFTA